MLTIRFLRQGRKNQAFFRVVLTEKGNPPKSRFQKIFGWYNPKTKESSLNKEEILSWVEKGAKPSNSVAKLLIAQKITHKNIKFVPDAPGEKKEKGEAKPKEQNPVSEKTEGVPSEEEVEKEVKEEKTEQEIPVSEGPVKGTDDSKEKLKDDKKPSQVDLDGQEGQSQE